MGYEMYRLLTSRRVLAYRPKTRKKRSDAKEKDKDKEKKDGKPEVIDLDEEDRNKELMASKSLVYIYTKFVSLNLSQIY